MLHRNQFPIAMQQQLKASRVTPAQAVVTGAVALTCFAAVAAAATIAVIAIPF
jgi:hypothetical protein